MGTGTRMRTETGTRTGSGRAEETWRSAKSHTRVVDAMWETGETWVEREKKRVNRKERVSSLATDPDNLENINSNRIGTQSSSKNCKSRECVPFAVLD